MARRWMLRQRLIIPNSGGNFYCQLVHAITYTSVGGEGTYNRVTDMDSNSGSCANSPYDYSGSIAPLDEEVGGQEEIRCSSSTG